MKSASLLPLLLLSVIGQSLGNNAADFNNLSSLEKCISPLPATSEGHTKDIVEGVDIRKRVTVDDGMVLDFCPIPTVPYHAHERVGFDKINSDRSGHDSLQHNASITKSVVADVVDFLSEIPNGLKDFVKVDVAEVLNATLSSIQNGFNSVKSLGAKCLVWDMSPIRTFANRLMVVLLVSIVFMPRFSMHLLLSLAACCLCFCFAGRRCGELFRALRQRRDPNDIAQGGRGDPRPVVRLIYDTAHLVYQDAAHWHRNNWNALIDAVEEHLLRFWSPQRDPPPVGDPAERRQGVLVPDPAQHVVDRQEANMPMLP